MYEVELKVRTDHDPIRERLRGLDAEHVGRVTQADIYYDPPHRDFAKTDEALRLRRETIHAEGRTDVRLTYKGPLVEEESKTRREFETGVEDGQTMDAILGELGFSPAAVVEKERDRYRLDGYTVSLDAVSNLGEFVEVERAADDETIETVRDGAYEVLRTLDLGPDEQIRTSYLGLLLDAQ
jgi:adenylate cyclase class 2